MNSGSKCGRLDMRSISQQTWSSHRHGWRFVVNNLLRFHAENGLRVDGCIDASFGYLFDETRSRQGGPYHKQWIGFIHHPPEICPWFFDESFTIKTTLNNLRQSEALATCTGIFKLSNHLRQAIQKEMPEARVYSLMHPTAFNVRQFSFADYSRTPRVVHVGYWMRKLSSFFDLVAQRIPKLLLVGNVTLDYLHAELEYFGKGAILEGTDVNFVKALPNKYYDQLLAQSVVFVDLFDSSANNTIVECIARATPILVNSHPAASEYLGHGYPLFYSNLDDAANKLKDKELIHEASQYLRNELLRRRLRINCFLDELFCKDIFVER